MKRKGQKKRVRGKCDDGRSSDMVLLVLKLEEGGQEPRNVNGLFKLSRAGKRFYPEPTEGNAALLCQTADLPTEL